jgi:hypothetical protein
VVAETETGTIAKGDAEPTAALATRDVPVEPAGVSARADVAAVSAVTPNTSTSVTLSLHIHLNSPEDLTDDYAARIREWLELVRGTAPEVQVDVQPDTTSGG